MKRKYKKGVCSFCFQKKKVFATHYGSDGHSRYMCNDCKEEINDLCKHILHTDNEVDDFDYKYAKRR